MTDSLIILPFIAVKSELFATLLHKQLINIYNPDTSENIDYLFHYRWLLCCFWSFITTYNISAGTKGSDTHMCQYLLIFVSIYFNGLFILKDESTDTTHIWSFMQAENELC